MRTKSSSYAFAAFTISLLHQGSCATLAAPRALAIREDAMRSTCNYVVRKNDSPLSTSVTVKLSEYEGWPQSLCDEEALSAFIRPFCPLVADPLWPRAMVWYHPHERFCSVSFLTRANLECVTKMLDCLAVVPTAAKPICKPLIDEAEAEANRLERERLEAEAYAKAVAEAKAKAKAEGKTYEEEPSEAEPSNPDVSPSDESQAGEPQPDEPQAGESQPDGNGSQPDGSQPNGSQSEEAKPEASPPLVSQP